MEEKGKKKGKGVAAVNGETQLGEVMIESIQSFLTGKEAARTAILSKSWYKTWLTRPTLDFDEHDFENGDGFLEFATNTMQRYRHSNRRIESFRLRINISVGRVGGYFTRMIVAAMEIGATHLNLNLNLNRHNIDGSAGSVLPAEVLGSKTLTRLSVTDAKIDETSVSAIGCWRLESLSLERVHADSESLINHVFSSCTWIEELSLCECTTYTINGNLPMPWSDVNVCKLQKLRSLCLKGMTAYSLFCINFACLPCLKDLKVADCTWSLYERMELLASSSLEHISFVNVTELKLDFDVPNIRRFVYLAIYLISPLNQLVQGNGRGSPT